MQVIKSFCLFICLFASVSLFSQSAQGIWETIDQVSTAFSNYDADAFGSYFTDDAHLVSPMGHVLDGKVAITEGHRGLFASLGTPNPDVVDVFSDKKVVTLGDGLVLASFIDESTGDPKTDGKLAFTMLLTEDGGKWLIRSVQMTPVVPMPGK